jgi:hypothetical protein
MRSTNVPDGSVWIREHVVRNRQTQLTRSSALRAMRRCLHVTYRLCELSADCERLLERVMTQQGPSARSRPHSKGNNGKVEDKADRQSEGPSASG